MGQQGQNGFSPFLPSVFAVISHRAGWSISSRQGAAQSAANALSSIAAMDEYTVEPNFKKSTLYAPQQPRSFAIWLSQMVESIFRFSFHLWQLFLSRFPATAGRSIPDGRAGNGVWTSGWQSGWMSWNITSVTYGPGQWRRFSHWQVWGPRQHSFSSLAWL